MRLPFGFELTRKQLPATFNNVDCRSGWWRITEPFTGAWQLNEEVNPTDVLSYFALYACVTLIASDIGKLRVKLMRDDDDGIAQEVETNSPFLPVLRKPNRNQTRVKFTEQWMLSKLIHGNAYILKARDARGVVNAMYVLDPCRVRPLVAEDGSVFYRLTRDYLATVEENEVIPASEIIHDTMEALYHPLCGVSPIMACGLGALQGLRIQQNSSNFFANGARPSGVLTAPGEISNDTAARLKSAWEEKFSGANFGRVAVLGDGLKFEPMVVTAEDSQLIEQLKFSAEMVCAAFHVPPFMIGIQAPPSGSVESLSTMYYTQCLQKLIEAAEILLDEGLALPSDMHTEFDLDGLLRMDTASLYDTIGKGIGGSLLAPNEARKRINLPPLEGGDSVYMQQQNFSLEALAKRDADNPFSKPAPAPAADTAPAANDNAEQAQQAAQAAFRGAFERAFA